MDVMGMLEDPSPLYFLGHSKGASLAVELCIVLEQSYHFTPRRIFNASMPAPEVCVYF
jgi:surfactin synthase thioesterase subunit